MREKYLLLSLHQRASRIRLKYSPGLVRVLMAKCRCSAVNYFSVYFCARFTLPNAPERGASKNDDGRQRFGFYTHIVQHASRLIAFFSGFSALSLTPSSAPETQQYPELIRAGLDSSDRSERLPGAVAQSSQRPVTHDGIIEAFEIGNTAIR